MTQGTDHAREIRIALKDPVALCSALGLTTGAKRQAGGLMICCVAHADRSPSCSVRIGPDGTVAVKCHGCGFAGDALSLIAEVHHLDLSTNFREILLIAADLAGLHTVVDELNGRKPYERREAPPPVEMAPERVYPALSEVRALWTGACPVTELEASKSLLEARALPAADVARFDLARAITANQPLPRWATYQGQSWRTAGYRILVPMFDASGEMRSVRAWRVEDGEGPKRLPPAGCRATGLVMANGWALTLLREKRGPRRVVVSEGESDFLSATLRWPGMPVFGVINGSWSVEFAARIPFGSELIIRTDNDLAGDKYAEQIIGTVKSRATVWRKSA